MRLLHILLAGHICRPLIDRTNILYKLYENSVKEEKDELLNKGLNLGFGIALGMGALGFIFAVKNKIF